MEGFLIALCGVAMFAIISIMGALWDSEVNDLEGQIKDLKQQVQMCEVPR